MDFRIYYIVLISLSLVESCLVSFNRYSCYFDVICTDQLDPNLNWDRFRRDYQGEACDRSIHYNGYLLYPVNLVYRQTDIDTSVPIPKTYQWGSQIMDIVYIFDLSRQGYDEMPVIKSMDHLAIINMTGNQLTTAILSNMNELNSLTEIDLSHNTISSIQGNTYPHPFSNMRTINLSHNYIVKIPDAVFDEIDNLQNLDLSYNYIDLLSAFTFEGIRKLSKLNLSNNRLTGVNSSLFRFSDLTKLDLSFNRIKDLKVNDFDRLGKLEQLDLNSNLIKSIDADVFKSVVSLNIIDLSNNQLETMNKNTFANFQSLVSVDLSKNQIKSMPVSVFKNSSIYTFFINQNRLEGSLEKGMFYGINVTRLDLSDQFLTEIGDYAFYYLIRLDTLLLNSNRIRSLSNLCFSTLTNLQQLDLSNNKITDIDFDKKDLSGLQTLLLKNNHLTQIKEEQLQHLTGLEYLDISENQISRLEPSSFKSLSNLINLEIYSNSLLGTLETGTFDGLTLLPGLDISRNKLTAVQNASFNGMSELKQLNMSACELSEIQYNVFVHTGYIETLDLSYNKLEDFNVNTTELVNLSVLMLNNNLIKVISSSSFKGLSRLNTITLSQNSIEDVNGKSFDSLLDLRHFDLSYNEKLNFSVSMLKKVKNLHTIILSGIKTSINLTDIGKDIPITNIVLSNSSINNINNLGLRDMTRLDTLKLSYNNISKLQIGDFTGISTLTYLDLSFNKISYIQPGVFKDNIHLNSLNMSHNSLTTIGYGIFRGLLYLNVLDLSYNNLRDLQSERFYEVNSLTELIVDNNKIDTITAEDFVGSRLTILSIGDNPLSCQLLVQLRKKGVRFELTAIRKDEHNHENINGVTCNKVQTNEQAPPYLPDKVVDNNDVLNGLRNILNNLTKNTEQDNKEIKALDKITDVLEKSNAVLNEKLSFLSDLTSRNIDLNNRTNMLLYKIMKSLDQNHPSGPADTSIVRLVGIPTTTTTTTTITPLVDHNSEVNQTVDVIPYIQQVKKELENTIAIEKQNIIHDIESKFSLNKYESESLPSGVAHEKLVSNVEGSKSLFTETCVALILFILVGLVLYKFYKSRMFIRNRFSYSTRELPGSMENSAL
ncbi:uncharacterized protein LOC142980086 [Anticarsia gemmatalis]|uniref:uncharacterized protein LOC142980086 n=1 Tax=Anticarsia gemmatalis TaxID=129554 RepID=UPI003F774D3F